MFFGSGLRQAWSQLGGEIAVVLLVESTDTPGTVVFDEFRLENMGIQPREPVGGRARTASGNEDLESCEDVVGLPRTQVVKPDESKTEDLIGCRGTEVGRRSDQGPHFAPAPECPASIAGRERMFQIGGGTEVRESPVAVLPEENPAQKLAEPGMSGLSLDAADLSGFVDQSKSNVGSSERAGKQIQAVLFFGLDLNNTADQVSFLAPSVQDASGASRFQVILPLDQGDGLFSRLDQDRSATASQEPPDDCDEVW